MYLISDEEITVIFLLSLLARQAPTILCYKNSGLIILEQYITVNTVTLRLHKLLGPHHQTERISNTYQFRLCGATGVQLLLP